METTSSTARNKPDNQNLTRSRSLGPKPKPVPSSEPESTTDGSGRKTVEKPLPNYLKPTVSSRPDPVKFLRKNKAVEDNQKLLRRRSFDRPLSSSSTHKSITTSSPPARPRDRPTVPREKPVTGLRSASFHGSSSRGGLRGSTTVNSAAVLASRGPPGVKKSGMSGTSSSKSRKEGSENVPKKYCSPPAPAHEDEKEIVKVEIDVQVSDHIEEDKDQVAQPDESKEEEKRELINEEQIEEQIEEQKEAENTQEDEVEKKVDVEEIRETVVTPDMKEAEIEAEFKEEEREGSKVKEGARETNAHDVEERTKKEVVKGKKGSPTVYNDVIASKMQESSSRKNKVLALAGAFQTVIDYETAASK
ncbi:Calmodulin-binding protein-like protein [Hirschfeldia incana]|nr:Calmodulin-binding protein-like protein [Hirschfeldia incana]